jgi:hypothetical protein
MLLEQRQESRRRRCYRHQLHGPSDDELARLNAMRLLLLFARRIEPRHQVIDLF